MLVLVLVLVPGLIAALGSSIAAFKGWRWLTFIASGVTITAIIFTAALSLFPFVPPSSIDLQSSLTVCNSVSSHNTLWVMLLVTLMLLPIVMLYTGRAYRVLRGPVTVDRIRRDTRYAYLEYASMWYFTWILGLGLAPAFGIINVMWLEFNSAFDELDENGTSRD